ncbi:hypothetical protein [Leptolyngbya sp. Cla-17]|nr:hypothetical protein [Leptolyngbya sp. Cla-17]
MAPRRNGWVCDVATRTELDAVWLKQAVSIGGAKRLQGWDKCDRR